MDRREGVETEDHPVLGLVQDGAVIECVPQYPPQPPLCEP
jgi:hypothetical protein